MTHWQPSQLEEGANSCPRNMVLQGNINKVMKHVNFALSAVVRINLFSGTYMCCGILVH